MRRADAPPTGWYPDPQGNARLRWWDGEDWADRYRPPPSPSELVAIGMRSRAAADLRTAASATSEHAQELAALRRRDAEEIALQVRQVARNEIERAADIFSARARAATRQIEPLISQYSNRVLRWLRILLILAVLLVIGWFVFQAVAQVTFFEWVGDRIDEIGGN